MTVNPGIEAPIETSLEGWVMELPEDEAGCEHPQVCQKPAVWREVNPCGCGWLICDHHYAVEMEIQDEYAHSLLGCDVCGFGPYFGLEIRFVRV